MKKIKILAVIILAIIVANIYSIKINAKASDLDFDITKNIPNAAALAEYYPPLRPCYTLADYGGIVGVWKCIPCIYLSFARPWGDFSYCMQGE